MISLRSIPSIEQLRQRERIRTLETTYGRSAVVDALRAETAGWRERLAGGGTVTDTVVDLERNVAIRLQEQSRPSLQPVINATGVVLHTNLGRAPLCAAAAERLMTLATTYSNLEYDLAAGARGKRDVHAERLICQLTGAEAAVVVNNNAAAVLLCLAALAAGREVVISRGELVEIGGGFRVPEVMRQSGAVLREIGTTNRTRANDYAAAVSDRTALILRVHPSNFRVEGFTERPTLESLVAVGRRLNLPVVEDLGSGYLGVPAAEPLANEPTIQSSVRAGADLVLFSGDKLFGGPQAGIIAGRRSLVTQVRQHPLMRALRVDKLTYGALEATLAEYASGRAASTVPVARMTAMTPDEIDVRARRVAAALATAGFAAVVLDGVSTIGGGSAPGVTMATRLVALQGGEAPNALEAALRRLTPPVIARIEEDRLVLDLRTVAPEHEELLVRQLTEARASLAAPGRTTP